MSKTKKVCYIKASNLNVDPLTKRDYYDEETKRRLVESIKQEGFKEEHALVVRPNPEKEGQWLITCGQNRYEAGIKAGQVVFPCIKRRKQDDLIALREAYDDNVLRVDPDPVTQAQYFYKVGIEILKGYGKKVNPLSQKFQMPIGRIAIELNEPEPFVKRRLVLLRLPRIVRKMVSRYYMKNQKGLKLSPALGEELVKVYEYFQKEGIKKPEMEAIKLAFKFFHEKTTQRDARKTFTEIALRGYENWKNSTDPSQKETRCAVCGAVTNRSSWISLCDEHKAQILSWQDDARLKKIEEIRKRSIVNPKLVPLHELDPEHHKLRDGPSEK
jgi:hypothetical protein